MPEEINDFALKHGIVLQDKETKLLYYYIKRDWRTIIYGNPRPILDELKANLEPLTYNKVEELYTMFKNQFQDYL
jgi:hypothetical protein